MEDNCVFCNIILGNIPSTKVYEDEYVLAFEDINPEAKVHVLIVPKKHIESLNEVNSENASYVFNVINAIKKVAEIKGIKESGYRIISNVGKDAGQTVKHLHFHLVGGQKLGDKVL